MQKVEKQQPPPPQQQQQQQFDTPLPSTATQVEITSSGRRRIRPMKFNDFADIKPKSASNENLVARHTQPELNETPVKERRRRRRGDREVIEMGSPLKDYDETKRTRYHANAAKLEGEERTSKRKHSLNEDEIDVSAHKRQRTTRGESSGATTPTRHTRGRSLTAGVHIKEDIPVEPEKTHKRRRTTGIQSIDEPSVIENIQIKEEPRTSQPEITRFGKLTSSAEKSNRENRLSLTQPVIKSEQIEVPRRGRKPKQPKQPVFESDTQSESTDAGRKFPKLGRPQRLSRAEPNYTSERRSSRNLSTQEHPNSPLTGASTEPSGDECLKSTDKRRGRHSRRSRGQSINDQEVMQPPVVENHSEDDIDSVIEDEPISSRKTKTVLADIFTKAAGKHGKRKRSSPIEKSPKSKIHGHRTSGRIAAAAAKRQPSPSSDGHASTPHHSHGGGGTSSDDQQFSNKKQMTLPEMMQMQKAKNSSAEQR